MTFKNMSISGWDVAFFKISFAIVTFCLMDNLPVVYIHRVSNVFLPVVQRFSFLILFFFFVSLQQNHFNYLLQRFDDIKDGKDLFSVTGQIHICYTTTGTFSFFFCFLAGLKITSSSSSVKRQLAVSFIFHFVRGRCLACEIQESSRFLIIEMG